MTVPLYSQVGSIPVVVDSNVPLVGPKRDHDRKIIEPRVEVPVLFWIIFGQIHVHPDRIEEFRRHITAPHSYPYEKSGE